MTRMVTVHQGALWEAQLLQGRLDAEAIQATIPDATVKQLDPFITGANPLEFRLQVASSDAPLALEVVREYLEVTRRDPAVDPQAENLDAGDARRAATWKLGLRLR